VFRGEHAQEEDPQQSVAVSLPLGLRLGQPVPQLCQALVRERVLLASAWAFGGDVDQSAFGEARECSVDLALGGGPDVDQRGVEEPIRSYPLAGLSTRRPRTA
jgi:hypothetical protein